MEESGKKHSEDYELVQAALEGKEAFAALVAKYQQRVYHAAYQVLRNQADAQDITQETFVRAYESLESFDPRYSFSAWVTKIAVNLSINAFKKRKKLPLPLGDVPERAAQPAGEPGRGPEISKEKILGTLDTLRPKHRVAFILFHMEKCSYMQIASIMEVPVSSVKNYLIRARRKLRAKLAAELKVTATGSS